MDRRDFGKSALLGAGVAAVLPAVGRAAAAGADKAENVIFTQADPGHWGADMAKLHVPEVSVAGGVVHVKTPHPQSDVHFIVSHTVVLAGGVFLDRKTFTSKIEPVSEHTLPDGYKGPITITSTCNLHDFWVKTVTV